MMAPIVPHGETHHRPYWHVPRAATLRQRRLAQARALLLAVGEAVDRLEAGCNLLGQLRRLRLEQASRSVHSGKWKVEGRR